MNREPRRPTPLPSSIDTSVEIPASRGPAALWHVSLLGGARYLAEMIHIVRGIVLARVLGPAGLGVWTQVRLALLFGQTTHFGAWDGMLRELPYAEGRGEDAYAEQLRRAGSSLTLITAGTVAVAAACFTTLGSRLGWIQDTRLWWTVAAVFFFQQVGAFLSALATAQQRFQMIGIATLLSATCMAVFGLGLATRYEVYGMLLGVGIAASVTLLWWGVQGVRLPRPQWKPDVVRELFRVGLPIMIAGVCHLLHWNIDKLLILILMDHAALGVYGAQAQLTNLVMLVPAVIGTVLYPRVMDRLGETESLELVSPYLIRPTTALAYGAAPVLGLLYLTIHLPFRWILPMYQDAIEPGRILIMMAFFMLVARMPATILVSLGRQKLLLGYTLGATLVSAIGVSGAIAGGFGLPGVAWATGLSFGVYYALVLTGASSAATYNSSSTAWFTCMLLVPWLAMLGSIVLAEALVDDRYAHWFVDGVMSLLRCAVFLLPMGALLLLQHKRKGLFLRGIEEPGA